MTEFKFRTTGRRWARALAWAGGAAFVLSLGYFVYFYMVGLDVASRTQPGWRDALGFDLALFSIFALHHSVMARSGAKRIIARVIPAPLERSSYVWAASLLLVLTCWLWRPIGGRFYQHAGLLRFVHLSIQLAGVWIIARATRMLDPLELAGIRQAVRWTTDSEPGADGCRDDTISNKGPYGWVRHPIYLGWLLMTFGVAHLTIDRMVFATISGIYLLVAIPFEERTLLATYGERYRSYMKRVRWRIVPFVW